VGESDPLVIAPPGPRFASRGGSKLDAALVRFDVAVSGKRCLDAGASTGGFTDCLLQRGASHVTAVDVGKGLMEARLRADPRVTLLERTNVRHLTPSTCGTDFQVVVADLSFISLRTVSNVLAEMLAAPGADLIFLVKPQFEVGRTVASRGRGVVRDESHRRAAIHGVAEALLRNGASILGAMASPILGPSGNAEFLLHAKAHSIPPGEGTAPESVRDDPELRELVDRAVLAAPDSASAPDTACAPDTASAPAGLSTRTSVLAGSRASNQRSKVGPRDVGGCQP
jgi:23S rRNA (cytidine1920-2'-O)/16S rRNA (cytidine1409-2'-O)-methyltransferase